MGPPDQPMDQPMDQRKRAALRGERDPYWKDIAWNGLFFRIPPAWEIGRIGLRYLLFEDDAGPVFELKWQPVKKGFSFDVHLKRLGAAYSRKRGIDLKPATLPEQWREALVGFEARFFLWGSGSATGQGAVLFCETCRTAHLLQFLRRDIVRNKRLCLGILRSFGDHPAGDEGGERLWAIYDIRAKVPCEYQLQRYRFTPGAFELAFSGPRREALSLFRWGPASVLLEHQSLRRFLDRQVPWVGPLPEMEPQRDNGSVRLEGALYAGLVEKWRLWLLRRPLYGWLEAAHHDHTNRILAVSAIGRHPPLAGRCSQICDHYETVSAKTGN
jgi:hypothetical protein